MSDTTLVPSTWSPFGAERAEAARPTAVAVAGSVALHIGAIALFAAFSVMTPVPAPPVRVVIIHADAGGGGSRGPLRAQAPPGEMAGPPAPALPPVPIEAAPVAPRIAAPERPRVAARPKPKQETRQPKPQPVRDQAVAQPAIDPTPGGGPTGGPELALSTGPSGGGGGGGGGSGGGAGTGSGTGVGSGRGPGVESAIAKYLRTVRKRLEAVKRYPMLAKRSGTEGTATLAIDIRRDGQPATVRVSDSSGSDLLDGEAAEMVDRAAPFDPLPPELNETTLRVVVPVSFDLGS